MGAMRQAHLGVQGKLFKASQQLLGRNRGAVGADGLFQEPRIIALFQQVNQVPVLDQRQHDRLGFPPLVDEHMVRFQHSVHRLLQTWQHTRSCIAGEKSSMRPWAGQTVVPHDEEEHA